MPRKLRQQRRGDRKPKYLARSHRFKSEVNYRTYDDAEKKEKVSGFIIDIFHDPSKSAPVMEIAFGTERVYLPAPKNVFVGQEIECGSKAKIGVGNVIPLGLIPEGSVVCDLELRPGDGGKMVRSAGASARVMTRDENGVIVKLPSKKLKIFNPDCRAMVGIVAAGGKIKKPFVKAGKKFFAVRSKAMIWPVTKGTCMNPVDHPHGGGHRRSKKKKTVGRNASPGQKVGSIAAKRTGRSR